MGVRLPKGWRVYTGKRTQPSRRDPTTEKRAHDLGEEMLSKGRYSAEGYDGNGNRWILRKPPCP